MIAKMIHIFSLFLFISLICLIPSQGQQNYQPLKPSRHDHPEVPRITAFEAMEFYKQGKLILANAHERARFAHGHIVGSISLSNGEVQASNIKLPTNGVERPCGSARPTCFSQKDVKPRRALIRVALTSRSSGSPLHSDSLSARPRYADSAQLRRCTHRLIGFYSSANNFLFPN